MTAPAARPASDPRSPGTSKAPLEVAPPPVLAKIDALLRDGKAADAVRLAFQTVEDDVRRAFGLKLPKQWTHRELLQKYLRPDMGLITALLPQLYARYEPVRYGAPGSVSGDGLLDLVRQIYQEPSLRRLSWTIGADSTLTSRPAAGRAGATPKTMGGGG